MSAPLIRVDSETYERLRRLRDERGCSFSKLLIELLEHAEVSGNPMPERCPKCGHDLKLDSSRGEPTFSWAQSGSRYILRPAQNAYGPSRRSSHGSRFRRDKISIHDLLARGFA
ncbi:MAG: hypothetical protein QXY27_06055 [Nitrososphaerota archaeon]